MARFQLIKKEGKARRAVLQTAHGTIQTPVFMNVATQAAIIGIWAGCTGLCTGTARS